MKALCDQPKNGPGCPRVVDALTLEDVHLGYPGRPTVLDGVSLTLTQGQVVVVRGRSGSGKSTLLAVASGLEVPQAGRVRVMGEPLDPADPAQRARVRARHVGFVFQHLHLLGELDLRENVELPMRLAHVARATARDRALRLLDSFGLRKLAHRRPSQVSGGEQQRAAIARALSMQPTVLLVDEPTSNLDAANAMTVVQALRTAASEGAAVLVASHDELLASAGRNLRLEGGRLEPLAR